MTLRRHILLGAAALSLASLAQAQSQGIKDNEIVLGTHLDLSGPVAAGMPGSRFAAAAPICAGSCWMNTLPPAVRGGNHGRSVPRLRQRG